MNSHKNARLTAKGRAPLIEQIPLLGLDAFEQRGHVLHQRIALQDLTQIYASNVWRQPAEVAEAQP